MPILNAYREPDSIEVRKVDRPHYCPHGTYVGNPYGADLMCGMCEDGVTWTEFEDYVSSNVMHEYADAYRWAVFAWLGETLN